MKASKTEDATSQGFIEALKRTFSRESVWFWRLGYIVGVGAIVWAGLNRTLPGVAQKLGITDNAQLLLAFFFLSFMIGALATHVYDEFLSARSRLELLRGELREFNDNFKGGLDRLESGLGRVSQDVSGRRTVQLFENPADVYQQAVILVGEAARQTELQATDLRLLKRDKDDASRQAGYLDKIVPLIKTNDLTYLRAISAIQTEFETLVEQNTALLESGAKVKVRYYTGNPVSLDILITDKAALFALPDRAADPRTALIIRDERAVGRLRKWYERVIWNSQLGTDITSVDQLGAVHPSAT